MDVMIFVLVNLLFVADIICAGAFVVQPLEIGTLGKISCDHAENDPGIRIVQWYKSKRINEFINGDPSLAQWVDGATDSQSNYHMENNTFSLVIEKATSEDEGLYECSVERGDTYTQTPYYTRTVMYVLPRKDPDITFNSTLNRVNCTVEHVKPLIYPEFNSNCSHASTVTYAFLNKDGTYTTSVNCAVPQNKSASQVHCSFSYLHYKRVVSLDLRDTITDSLIEDKTTTVSPVGTSVTCAGDGRRTTDHTQSNVLNIVVGLLSGVSFIMLIIILVICQMLRRKCRQGMQNCNTTESTEKMIKPDMGMGVEETELEVGVTKVV